MGKRSLSFEILHKPTFANQLLAISKEPMSLYWYGRRSVFERPLLAFLAFYQVLEFYFPAYSPSARMDALRAKLEEIAAGDVEESDIEGVLEAAGTSKRRLFPQERQQLAGTIKRCVEPDDLAYFLTADDARTHFWGSDGARALSGHEIPVGPSSKGGRRGDHRNKVAQRIYEIRNRIVHTKSEHDDDLLGPLLPFDLEVDLLERDVGLVRFLAEKVLSASARPLDAEAPLGALDPSPEGAA